MRGALEVWSKGIPVTLRKPAPYGYWSLSCAYPTGLLVLGQASESPKFPPAGPLNGEKILRFSLGTLFFLRFPLFLSSVHPLGNLIHPMKK